MMKKMVVALVLPVALAVSAFAADLKLDGVKCLVAGGQPAKAANASDYKGGKVFFCCGNCQKKFDAAPAALSVKANHQLVLTGQAKQSKCPLSGGPCKEDKVVEVGGAKVFFCCDNCKGKVAGAKGDEQAALVFSDAAFEKGGFKVAK
jgi:YHS domain-containing protein